jgi:transglutaminase-like putative cysteine protease
MVARLTPLAISDSVSTALAIGYIGFYPIDYYFLSRDFLTSTIHLVFFLAAVLVVKASSPRDYFFLKLIALLELLAASLLSTSVNFLLCLGIFVLCGVAAQVSGEMHGNLLSRKAVAREGIRGAHRRLAGLTLCLLTGILIIATGLFFVLPRTARAALQHLIPERYHLSGFSNEVVLGKFGELRLSSTPVMHVRAENPAYLHALKWRGTALRQFNGAKWYNDTDSGVRLLTSGRQVRLVTDEEIWARKGTRVSYEVQLKAPTSDVLFIAGFPEYLSVDSPQIIRTPVDGYRLGAGLARGARYQASAVLPDRVPQPLAIEPSLPGTERREYLQLPKLDPRIPALARNLVAGAPNDLTRARKIEQHLRTSYGYTTELLSRAVDDPLANFLFTRRAGHCEYFASAMAVMLRTAGIPSRVATGFQSGTFNPISGWYVVRSSDAHSWVEAWIPQYGWLTFDPTPPDTRGQTATLWSQTQLYLDALDVFWQEWVMSYDLQRQLQLAGTMGQSGRSLSADWLRRLPFSSLDWKRLWYSVDLGLLVAIGGALVWLVAAIWLGPRVWRWWKMRQRVRMLLTNHGNASDATVLYERMLELLRRRGVQKPAWVTPSEFAGMVPWPPVRDLVEDLTREYNGLRFGGRGDAAPRMVALLDQLERTS